MAVQCDVTYNSTTISSVEETIPVSVTYNGSEIASIESGTKTLKCSGKVMNSDVVVGTKTLKCNGKIMASDVVINLQNLSYTVTITRLDAARNATVTVYDGIDTSGTLLGTIPKETYRTYTVSSGYLYLALTSGYTMTITSTTGGVSKANPSTITGDGTMYIDVDM